MYSSIFAMGFSFLNRRSVLAFLIWFLRGVHSWPSVIFTALGLATALRLGAQPEPAQIVG
jgi:hypothetical protein